MQRIVGLYIRHGGVETVELNRGLTGFTVGRFGRFPLLSTDPGKLTEAITGALEAARIKTRDAIVAIPSQEIFLRYFLLPVIPKAEWHNAVKFEARKYVPFKMEELIWDSCILEQPMLRQLGVVFVGVRKEVLTQYITCVRNAGLRLLAVEAASFSLARTLQYQRGKTDDKVIVVIDLSEDVAHVALVKKGVPLLARDVSLTPPAEERSIEELVRSQMAARQSPSTATDSKERLDHLVNELHLSLDYFAREFPNDQIQEVVLYGERVDDAWLQTLQQEFHLTAAIGDSIAAIRGSHQLQGGWVVPLGLGLRMVQAKGPQVNLLQGETGSVVTKAPRQAFWWMGVEVAIAAVVLIALYAALSQQAVMAQQQLTIVQRQRIALKFPMEQASVAELQQKRGQLEQQLALLRSLIRDRLPLTPKLGTLPTLLPEGVWLDRLIYSSAGETVAGGQMLTLQGFCYRDSASQELELVSQLAESFRKNATLFQGFERTELTSVKNIVIERFNATAFELHCLTEKARAGTP